MTPLIWKASNEAATNETPTSAATNCTMVTNCGTLGPRVGSNPALRHAAITVSNKLGVSSRRCEIKLSSRRSAKFSFAVLAARCLIGNAAINGAQNAQRRSAVVDFLITGEYLVGCLP